MSAVESYLALAKRHPPLSREVEAELAGRASAGDEEAAWQLALHTIRYVVHEAKRYSHTRTPLEDLIGTGLFGAWEAATKFDPSQGNRFSTYAHYQIHRRVREAVSMERAKGILSPDNHQKWLRTRRHYARLRSEGREPTVNDIAESTGLRVPMVEALQSLVIDDTSLDAPVDGEAEGTPLGHIIPSEIDLEDARTEDEARAELDAVMDQVLSSRERAILRLYYGLDGTGEMPGPDIAHFLGVSGTRVNQLLHRALDKLREAMTMQAA